MAIGETRVDVMGLDQQRPKLRAPPFVAAGRERPQSVAVVALAPRNDMPTPRLALLDEILPRHFQRRLDRLRAAADEIDVAEPGRSVFDQPVGEPLGDVGREKGGVGVGERVELPVQGGDDVGMAMTEARNRRAARRVEVNLAVGVEELDAAAADGDRHVGFGDAVEDVGHSGDVPFGRGGVRVEADRTERPKVAPRPP